MTALPYGDSSKYYNDATRFYGDRPYPYPRKLHVKLEVKTASGSDFTDKATDTSLRVKSVIPCINDRFWFIFKETGESDIDEHDEVILKDSDENHLFGGFVHSFTDWEVGPYFWYKVTCVSYAWLLQAPTRITKVWEDGTSDSDIIADLGDYVDELDFTTHVETIESSLDTFYANNETPWQILTRICELTGGRFRVDYGPAGSKKAHLHHQLTQWQVHVLRVCKEAENSLLLLLDLRYPAR